MKGAGMPRGWYALGPATMSTKARAAGKRRSKLAARPRAAGKRPSASKIPASKSPSLLKFFEEVQRVADDQRRQIARRLHDSAQQSVAAVSMSLSLLERQVDDLPPAARKTLADAMRRADACNEELRAISRAIHPPLLEGLGLGPALEGLRAQLGSDRVALTMAELSELDGRLELAAYKLIEDAIAGLFASDAPVAIEVKLDAGALALEVAGTPRHADAVNGTVQRLRLRTRSVGGRLRLRANAGRLMVSVRLGLTSAPT